MNNYLRGECIDCGKPYHESWPGCPYCNAWFPRDGENESERAVRRERIVGERRGQSAVLCGVGSASGPNGEMLLCGFPARHAGPHAWASLPTWAMVSVGDEQVVQDVPVRRLEPGEHRNQN